MPQQPDSSSVPVVFPSNDPSWGQLSLARGVIKGHSAVLKFGRNTDVDTAANEDIWDGGGVWVPPTAARIHNLASTDATDDDGDDGARTVEVFGLDANFLEISETVTLNGVSNVSTVNSYTRIHRMKVKTAGVDGQNNGTIAATAVTDATVTAQISIGQNQTLMAIYTILAGKTGYMVSFFANMNRSNSTGSADIRLLIRPENEVYQVKAHVGIIGSGTSHFMHVYIVPLKINAKSDIKIDGNVSSNNTDLSAGFDLALRSN